MPEQVAEGAEATKPVVSCAENDEYIMCDELLIYRSTEVRRLSLPNRIVGWHYVVCWQKDAHTDRPSC